MSTLKSLTPQFVGPSGATKDLPDALLWAGPSAGDYEEPRLIFADRYDDERSHSINDFLICSEPSVGEREPVSQVLLELLAHKRSRLFGFSLANRFVNVFLPHAILRSSHGESSDEEACWFLQPLVSFIRGGRDRGRLRGTYSLTFFLIPIAKGDSPFRLRAVSIRDIAGMVNAGWGFAASPGPDPTAQFDIAGELPKYLGDLSGFDLQLMRRRPFLHASSSKNEETWSELTLRQSIETIAFGVSLSIAQGGTGRANERVMRRIGNDVVMALGSARVSSVVVVDPNLEPCHVRALPGGADTFPKALSPLMEELAKSGRAPAPGDKKARKYRLDRPFVDSDLYAIGALPAKRCTVVVSSGKAQCGTRESALMQAGSVAYMTIGTATAIGTMREIDRRLEHLEGANNPKKIAEIDAEIASDLGEIYDLDITRESYREVYRLLRKRLGITRDYEILQSKMESLYRATSTVHEDNAQRLLLWLTVALAVLTVLLLIVGILTVVEP